MSAGILLNFPDIQVEKMDYVFDDEEMQDDSKYITKKHMNVSETDFQRHTIL